MLLRTTKLAQSTSQYYFVLQVLQSLHKVLPSITWYYKACTKHVPVLLRTRKLAQSTSQCSFVLESLHKVLPSAPSYYKACTKYFPVLFRTTSTTKLAQSTSSATSYYKACTKPLPSATSYYKATAAHTHVECHKVPRLRRKTTWAHLLTRDKATFFFLASPIDTATFLRWSRAHIPLHTRRMSQSATPATQNDMSTDSDTWRKAPFCDFPRRHGNFSATMAAHTFLLTHVECHKVPRLPRRTIWQHLLTRGERHSFLASPVDTATFLRRPRAHIPPHTGRMSQSATAATQNDMRTSSDTWRKARFCGFPHRHGIPPHTRRMLHRATPATQNDMTTSSDTSRKTRFCDFPHRHGSFTLRTIVRGWLRTFADTRSRVTRTRVNP